MNATDKASSTPDDRPLPDVRGLNFSDLGADPALAAALRRLLADIADDDGAISAFGSAVPEPGEDVS